MGCRKLTYYTTETTPLKVVQGKALESEKVAQGFISVDPLFKTYPWYSPYQFAGNKPIKFIDLDGLEEAEKSFSNKDLLKTFTSDEVNKHCKEANSSAKKVFRGSIGAQVNGYGAKFKVSNYLTMDARIYIFPIKVEGDESEIVVNTSVAKVSAGLEINNIVSVGGSASFVNAEIKSDEDGVTEDSELLQTSEGVSVDNVTANENKVELTISTGETEESGIVVLDKVKETYEHVIEAIGAFFETLIDDKTNGTYTGNTDEDTNHENH